MTRLIGAILAFGLLSGCATYFKTDDEIAFSGQGVLASYDQSKGELTDLNRVEASMNRQQMKPVELATERVNFKELALTDFDGLTAQPLKRSTWKSSQTIPFRRNR